MKNNDQLACCTHRERGSCANGRATRTGDLARRVLDAIQSELLAPDAIALLITEYHEERKRLRATGLQRQDAINAEIVRPES